VAHAGGPRPQPDVIARLVGQLGAAGVRGCATLDGTMPQQERVENLRRFQAEPAVRARPGAVKRP
jgi:hypothetical protein